MFGRCRCDSWFYLTKLPYDLQMYFRKTDYPLSPCPLMLQNYPSFHQNIAVPFQQVWKKCLRCYLQISSNCSESWIDQYLSSHLMLIQFPGPSRLYRRRSPFVHRSQTHQTQFGCVWWLHPQPIRQKKGRNFCRHWTNGSMIVFTKGRGSNNSAYSEMRFVNTCKH